MNINKTITILILIILPSLSNAEVIGTWFDGLGSSSFGDSTLKIYSKNGRYFVHRKNGDGSGGTYEVRKSGNKYIKINDLHGLYFVVTKEGLKLEDRVGYIRTAKPVQK